MKEIRKKIKKQKTPLMAMCFVGDWLQLESRERANPSKRHSYYTPATHKKSSVKMLIRLYL